MAGTTVDFLAGPTVWRFMNSDKFYSVICSNRGGGKTSGAFMRTIRRAMARHPDTKEYIYKDYWPLRWAVIRDTRKNLGMTTAVTMKRWCPEPFAQWRGKVEEPESCTVFVNKVAVTHYDFFGVNSDADHNRFQSYEASGGVWIEEPAPVTTNTEFISSGIAETVLATAVTCLRASPDPCVQVSMNPPSADHWTAQLWHLPGYEAVDTESDMPEEQQRAREGIRENTNIYIIPPRENAAERVTPGYMERNRTMLMAAGRPDLVARLVDGTVGYAQVGAQVTPEFNGAHKAFELKVIPNVPFLLLFDFGLNPTCIVTQISPQGTWLFHKAWSRTNRGMKQLLEQDVHPWLMGQPVRQWRYIGGPEAREREQSNSEMTALKAIIDELGMSSYQSGPVSWSARRDAMKEALTKFPGGQPWIRIDVRGCALLVRCLEGGWHYPTVNGQVRNEGQPNKHCVDASTEILTLQGWKTYDQLRRGEEVWGYQHNTSYAQVHGNKDPRAHQLVPTIVEDIHQYHEPTDVMYLQHSTLDMCVTYEHKNIVQRRTTRRLHDGGVQERVSTPELVPTNQLHSGHFLICAAERQGDYRYRSQKVVSDDFVRLAAWVMTEGSYTSSEISLAQSYTANPQYVDEIWQIVRKYPSCITQGTDNTRTVTTWNIRGEMQYLLKHFMPEKCPSPDFINKMTTDQIRLFLYEAIKGDGDWGNQQTYLDTIPENECFWQHPTTPRIVCGNTMMAEAIQHMAMMIGMRTTMQDWRNTERYGTWAKNCVKVSLLRRSHVAKVSGLTQKEGREPFVWCPQTGTGTWVARRNGTVFLTGNSQWDHLGDAFAHGCAVLLHKTDRQSRTAEKQRVHVYHPPIPQIAVRSRTGV